MAVLPTINLELSDADIKRIAHAVVLEMAERQSQQKKVKWFTATEAASYIGRGRTKFYKMKNEGLFEPHDGLYSADDLDRAIGRLPQTS